MTKAKLHRYVGLAFALLLLVGFMDAGVKSTPQLAPLDHTVIGYLVSDKNALREEFEDVSKYLACTLENTGKRKCAREIGWPTLNYLDSLPKIKEQYSNLTDIPLIDTDDFEARAVQEIYFYGHYLQAVELPALKTKIYTAHALLFLCILIAIFKRESIGRILCNGYSILWATLRRLPRVILGAAKSLHQKV